MIKGKKCKKKRQYMWGLWKCQPELLANIQIKLNKARKHGYQQTDEAFDFLSSPEESVQEDIEELFGANSNKKKFLKVLTKIFAFLLNTNIENIEKIKRIIETTLKTWQEQKQL